MKEYYDQVKFIKSENDPSGARRAWFEIAVSEMIMLKFSDQTTLEEMTKIANDYLIKIKELDQLQTIDEQTQEIVE